MKTEELRVVLFNLSISFCSFIYDYSWICAKPRKNVHIPNISFFYVASVFKEVVRQMQYMLGVT